MKKKRKNIYFINKTTFSARRFSGFNTLSALRVTTKPAAIEEMLAELISINGFIGMIAAFSRITHIQCVILSWLIMTAENKHLQKQTVNTVVMIESMFIIYWLSIIEPGWVIG